MAYNKVEYAGVVLIDLTADSVTQADVVSGKTFHDKSGTSRSGSLVINKYYTGSTDPASSLGNNGDLYLKV